MYLNKFYYNVIKQSNISYYENKIHIFHKTILFLSSFLINLIVFL